MEPPLSLWQALSAWLPLQSRHPEKPPRFEYAEGEGGGAAGGTARADGEAAAEPPTCTQARSRRAMGEARAPTRKRRASAASSACAMAVVESSLSTDGADHRAREGRRAGTRQWTGAASFSAELLRRKIVRARAAGRALALQRGWRQRRSSRLAAQKRQADGRGGGLVAQPVARRAARAGGASSRLADGAGRSEGAAPAAHMDMQLAPLAEVLARRARRSRLSRRACSRRACARRSARARTEHTRHMPTHRAYTHAVAL